MRISEGGGGCMGELLMCILAGFLVYERLAVAEAGCVCGMWWMHL